MNEERALLLSVHPRFATAILAGSKTVEVRRQRVAVPPGTPVVIYATAPTMALVGTARVASVHVGSPSEVWAASRSRTGITRREYDEYMNGAAQASGLTLEEPVTFEEPVTLSALRSAGTFHPPQSYRYLPGEVLRQMAEVSPAAGPALLGVLDAPVLAQHAVTGVIGRGRAVAACVAAGMGAELVHRLRGERDAAEAWTKRLPGPLRRLDDRVLRG